MSAVCEPTVEEKSISVEPLVWEVRLGADQTPRRLIVVAIALLAGLIGIAWTHQAIIGVIGCLAILFSTSELFLPIRYRLDGTGASSNVGLSKTAIDWADVKRMTEDQKGVKLSPLAENSRLEPFRGVYLRFAGNQDEVLAKIRQLWGDHE
jgi:hypothetical protein